MTVSEKSIGGYGLLNENWLFGITNTESKKHRADCFREIGERTFSFFLDTAVEQGFEDREGQWTMSCEIVDAMQKKKHIAIEAGVGIGKSFAYIVPLLFYHQKYHCPILIATSTIALQDQLASDIKIIEDMIDYHPTVTIATVYKGNIIKNLIMDCQSYTKYRPNETTGGIFVSWRRKEELPTGA